MAQSDTLILPRPAAKGHRFSLTPLADAMFQLLIFFMLSSSLAPYSLLTIRSGPERQQAGEIVPGDEAAPDDTEVQALGANTVLWTLEPEKVTIGGQTFPYDALSAIAEGLALNDDAEVIIILRNQARVQDLARVLEALTAAGISAVQIIQGPT
ncbi:Biopolymer transport protein ExbD [Cognatiyoonia koreensis]|uniref:Biopolymer transport protein ExbD n=1 Tax=Cognatiyoonia koreensis TaxID=364200 RepID=A0A1I0RH24_9RHOB|nr:biopolymer transporter ExbD [Cognatiyoonia koreensis]SEW40100.1 Biopolymer transport protein ExbD [Cognatiyoonia koreensis]